jgi:hypothetical protein
LAAHHNVVTPSEQKMLDLSAKVIAMKDTRAGIFLGTS